MLWRKDHDYSSHIRLFNERSSKKIDNAERNGKRTAYLVQAIRDQIGRDLRAPKGVVTFRNTSQGSAAAEIPEGESKFLVEVEFGKVTLSTPVVVKRHANKVIVEAVGDIAREADLDDVVLNQSEILLQSLTSSAMNDFTTKVIDALNKEVSKYSPEP